MSELRQDVITKAWVIFATERTQRPHEFRSRDTSGEVLSGTKMCPFCPGNERMTPKEIMAYRSDDEDGPGWWVRVVPNRFPVLSPEASGGRSDDPFFRFMPGVGRHEVIIEAREHSAPFALMSDHQAEEVVLMYRARYRVLREDRTIKAIILFKNKGEAAGTSFEHPHAQIVGTPIIPRHLRHISAVATDYYHDTNRCIFCDLVEREREAKLRVVFESDEFVAFHPFASHSPFETWIAPKCHVPSFEQISIESAKRFAHVLKAVLLKIYRHLNDPDYNVVFRSAPVEDDNSPYFLWHVQIVPRLTTVAGFEIGSGMFINTALPEETAAYLNESS
jgi:UDPglucose--hexose-1-phosphate uridylyltransferase